VRPVALLYINLSEIAVYLSSCPRLITNYKLRVTLQATGRPGTPPKPILLGWVFSTKPPATAIATVPHGHHLRVAHSRPASCELLTMAKTLASSPENQAYAFGTLPSSSPVTPPCDSTADCSTLVILSEGREKRSRPESNDLLFVVIMNAGGPAAEAEGPLSPRRTFRRVPRSTALCWR